MGATCDSGFHSTDSGTSCTVCTVTDAATYGSECAVATCDSGVHSTDSGTSCTAATDTSTDTPTDDDDFLSGARECCDATGAAACCDVLDSATITRPAATIFLVSVTAAFFI